MQNWGQNLSKTEQTVNINFCEALMDLKWENLKLDKGIQNPDACCQTFSATDDVLWFFRILNSEGQKSVSGQQTHKLAFLFLKAILGKKNQNKKIQESCYRGNIPQNSHKIVR